jgi:type VI protein secretion system component Hcp
MASTTYTLEIPAFFSKDSALKTPILSLTIISQKGGRLRDPQLAPPPAREAEVGMYRYTDEASSRFLSHYMHGTLFPEVTVTASKESDRGPDPEPYFVITLTDAALSSYKLGREGQDRATDWIEFNCKEVTSRFIG